MEANLQHLAVYLYQKNLKCSLKEAREQLGISTGTLRTWIKQSEQESLQHGFHIEIRFLNLEMMIKDAEAFSMYIHNRAEGKDLRINYMMTRLLKDSDYIKIETLSDEMYVSRATLDRLIPEIKNIANEYHLSFESRPKYGIRLTGSEMNKRICLANYRELNMIPISTDEEKKEVQKIQEILFRTVKEYSLTFNDINFYNLIQHIFIAIRRIRSGNSITEIPDIAINHEIDNEKACTKEICDQLSKAFDIEINEAEEFYILIHMLGKRTFRNVNAISEEVLACVDDILNEIHEEKHIDLRGDSELITSLALHVQPLLSRLKFGLHQDNPILLEIKREMSTGYDLAVCASNVFKDKYGFVLSEEEIGYLAVYFTLAYERKKENTKHKKVVVICATGRGTARLIQYKLMKRYQYRNEDIILSSLYELEQMDLTDVDCIMTSLPLLKDYGLPVFYFGNIIDEDTGDMDAFFQRVNVSEHASFIDERLFFHDLNCKTREEVLTYITDEIQHIYHIDLKDQVMKREELSSTEVGRSLALPHPYAYDGKEIILAFAALKKSIKWKYKDVQYIIFMALPKDDPDSDQISQKVSELLFDNDALKELFTDPTAESCKEFFGERTCES